MLFTSRSVNLQGTKTGDAFASMSAAFDPPEKEVNTNAGKLGDLLYRPGEAHMYILYLNHTLVGVLGVPFPFKMVNLLPETEILK